MRIRPGTGRGAECRWKQRYNGRSANDVGMKRADFNAMRAAQGGRCAICNTAATLCADHCHRTGVVRGLLCSPCNLSIGKMKDDPVRLRSAADYLERNAATLE